MIRVDLDGVRIQPMSELERVMNSAELDEGVRIFEATMSRLEAAFTVSLLSSRLKPGEGVLSPKTPDAEIVAAGQRNGFTSILLGDLVPDGSFVPSDVALLDPERQRIQRRRHLTVRDYVSADTPIESALPRLASESFLLVLKHTAVNSIVTPADLNKLPVRTLIGAMLNRLENLLDGEIQAANHPSRGDEWLRHLAPERREKIEQFFTQKRKRDREISLLACATFADKLNVAVSITSIRKKLDSDPDVLEADKRGIAPMRNAIAHGRDFVNGSRKKGTDSGAAGFQKRVQRLRHWINALSPAASEVEIERIHS